MFSTERLEEEFVPFPSISSGSQSEEARDFRTLERDKTAAIQGNRRIEGRGFASQRCEMHDTSRAAHHISIEDLASNLESAVHAAWPRRFDSRYFKIEVLLLRWVEDDLGVEEEITRLRHVFEDLYKYKVHVYEIPSSLPGKNLGKRLDDFLEDAEHLGREKLLVIYYGGHAKQALHASGPPIWLANRHPKSPELPSAIVQAKIEEAFEDVLLLLDCCFSAATTTTGSFQTNNSVTEVIAACGYESIAPEVDQHSFSNALIETLADLSQVEPFSVAELHNRVLARIKCFARMLATAPDGTTVRNKENGRLLYERQRRRTPVYSVLCESEPRRSIILQPMKVPTKDISMQNGSKQNTLESFQDAPQKTTIKSLGKRRFIDAPKFPQLIISVRLDGPELDVARWKEFLLSLPVEGKDVNIEGVWGSFSTLLLLRLPVALWNMLPPDPACSFVGYATSENRFLRSPALDETMVREESDVFAPVSSHDGISQEETMRGRSDDTEWMGSISSVDEVEGSDSDTIGSSTCPGLAELRSEGRSPSYISTSTVLTDRFEALALGTEPLDDPALSAKPKVPNASGSAISAASKQIETHIGPHFIGSSTQRRGKTKNDRTTELAYDYFWTWKCHNCHMTGMATKSHHRCVECEHIRCDHCRLTQRKRMAA